MTIDDFKALKDKIEKAKTAKARAEGAMARIEKQFKDEFECDISECQKVIARLVAEKEKLEARQAKALSKLDEMFDWNAI